MYKCVGGPRDGQYVEVTPGAKDIILQTPTKPPPSMSEPMDLMTMDDVVEITVTRYTLRTIASHGLTVIRYLAPEDWSDTRAIEYQFTK